MLPIQSHSHHGKNSHPRCKTVRPTLQKKQTSQSGAVHTYGKIHTKGEAIRPNPRKRRLFNSELFTPVKIFTSRYESVRLNSRKCILPNPEPFTFVKKLTPQVWNRHPIHEKCRHPNPEPFTPVSVRPSQPIHENADFSIQSYLHLWKYSHPRCETIRPNSRKCKLPNLDPVREEGKG